MVIMLLGCLSQYNFKKLKEKNLMTKGKIPLRPLYGTQGARTWEAGA